MILEFFLFDLAKDEHSKSCEMFILEKITFLTLTDMQFSEVSIFGTFYCDFPPFKRLEAFQLIQNFVNYLLSHK